MYLLPLLERYARRRLGKLGVHSRFVDTPQARIHLYEARDAGAKGLPLVIFHGLGASATSFGPVLARLRGVSPRILAPEAPGHGFSRAHRGSLGLNDLLASLSLVLDQELDEPAIFIGNSLGGAMALRYASRNPERVAGLVLASPAGAPLSAPVFHDLIGKFRIRTHRDTHALLSRLYHRPPWYSALVVPDMRRRFRARFFRALLETLSQEESLTTAELSQLKAPILLLWGQSERLLPSESLEFFRANLPAHASIVEPTNYGHCPHLDQSSDLARRITEFSRDIAAQRDCARPQPAETSRSIR